MCDRYRESRANLTLFGQRRFFILDLNDLAVILVILITVLPERSGRPQDSADGSLVKAAPGSKSLLDLRLEGGLDKLDHPGRVNT